jgi:Arylsulfotransferase (ASST)
MSIEHSWRRPVSIGTAPKPATILLYAVLLASSAGAVAAPSVYPTGVTRYDPQAAYNCDVLFSAADNTTYLIDMNGHVLHHWDYEGFPSKMIDPALMHGTEGDVGLQLSTLPGGRGAGQTGVVPGRPAQFRDKSFGVVSWDGRIVWQWGSEAPGGAVLQHHDWERLANGDMLILANKRGRLVGFGNRPKLDDVIYEVDANGHLVWSWAASEHLDEFGFTPRELQLVERVSAPDYLHMNDMQVLGPNHWEQAGDARFAADNIMVSSRNTSFIAIISRKSGQVVWRLGPNFPRPVTPNGPLGPQPGSSAQDIGQLSGEHDAHMIPEGLPGAGDILVFDNEGTAGYPPVATPMIGGSRVLEINPMTRKVVWEYAGTKITMYSPYISSAQRLPNGNTLIDEGIDGRFFQVTPEKKIVWEYVSPILGPDQAPGGQALTNSVYRIQGVPYAWVPLHGPHSQVPVTPPPLAAFHIPAR